jgi:hypothetical protein
MSDYQDGESGLAERNSRLRGGLQRDFVKPFFLMTSDILEI